MRRKNIIQYNERKTTSPSRSVVWFCLCSFIVIFLASDLAFAKPQKNYLDPTDILESHINISKNNNKQTKDITAAPKPVAIKIEAKSTSPVSFVAKDSTASNKLMSARITSAVSKKTSESKSELRNLIDQINSVKINTKKKQTKIPSEKIAPENIKDEPLQNAFNKTSQKESYEFSTTNNDGFTKNNFDEGEQPGRLKEETIKSIKDLINNPESFNSFFELGEIMFDSNRLSDAYVFYKRALDSTDKNDKENRSWILFQTANCLRNTDYSKAIEYYKRLITEFPHCEWSEFAKDQIELLGWYLNDNPQGLIRKSRILVE